MLRLIAVFAVFALVTLSLMPIQWVAVALKRPLRRRIPVVYHRFVCRLLGIRVRLTGAAIDTRPLLIVANHSSWLDISIITSLAPVVFVAKAEIERVLDAAEAIMQREDALAQAIRSGTPISQVMAGNYENMLKKA